MTSRKKLLDQCQQESVGKTKKIVVNKCYGGFGLSMKALRRLAELKGHEVYFYVTSKYKHKDGVDEYKRIEDESEKRLCAHCLKQDLGLTCGDEINKADFMNDRDIDRDDPDLIRVVEELGDEANGQFAALHITEIPEGIEWEIGEYDGQEWVEEKHERW